MGYRKTYQRLLLDAGVAELVKTASTSENIKRAGFYTLANSTAGGSRGFTLDAPSNTAGDRVILYTQTISTSTGTDNVTVTCSTGVTLDGSNNRATFDAAGESLALVGLSATRWAVWVNTGSVSLSTA